MERRLFLKLGTGAALTGTLAACGGDGAPAATAPHPVAPAEPVRNKVVLAWNEAALSAIRATRPAPPMATRSLAMLHTAMYDAWAAYDARALSTRTGDSLRRPASEHTLAKRTRAFSYAAYVTLLDQFPTQKAAFDARMAALGYDPAAALPDIGSPAGIGTLAARTLLTHAHRDGSNQGGKHTPGGAAFADYSGYAPLNPPLVVAQPTPRSAIPAPGRWQPLTLRDGGGVLRTQAFVAPYWGQVKPFALASGFQFRPPPPAEFGSQAFIAQARQLVEIQASLSDTQKAMADYWAGGASGELPPCYWCQFAQWVSVRDQHDDDADIRMFFALANALFDAGIGVWDAKRAFDSARPISAIRYLMNGTIVTGFGPGGAAAGLQRIAGETWTPLIPTPPFPDHVSGHSSFSAASAEVLKRITGSDAFRHSVTLAPRSLQVDPTLPSAPLTLTWDTFSQAAREAGVSRLYAGIHFEQADQAGRALGARIGATVFEKAQSFWLGRA